MRGKDYFTPLRASAQQQTTPAALGLLGTPISASGTPLSPIKSSGVSPSSPSPLGVFSLSSSPSLSFHSVPPLHISCLAHCSSSWPTTSHPLLLSTALTMSHSVSNSKWPLSIQTLQRHPMAPAPPRKHRIACPSSSPISRAGKRSSPYTLALPLPYGISLSIYACHYTYFAPQIDPNNPPWPAYRGYHE